MTMRISFGSDERRGAMFYQAHIFFIYRGGGGALGLIRNLITAQNFHQNRKNGRKIARNRKPAENNGQHSKFVIFNPSILDTTANIGFIYGAYLS